MRDQVDTVETTKHLGLVDRVPLVEAQLAEDRVELRVTEFWDKAVTVETLVETGTLEVVVEQVETQAMELDLFQETVFKAIFLEQTTTGVVEEERADTATLVLEEASVEVAVVETAELETQTALIQLKMAYQETVVISMADLEELTLVVELEDTPIKVAQAAQRGVALELWSLDTQLEQHKDGTIYMEVR